MIKKSLWVLTFSLLFVVICFTNINTTKATTFIEPIHKPEETEIINTELFKPQGLIKNGIGTYAVDIGIGTVKISDSLSTLNALRDEKTRSFKDMETFKGASVQIASYIPVVGQWIEKGSTIWSHLENVKSDVGSGKGTSVKVTTSYSDRYFYHWLYVYNNTWKDMGASISRYWYKHVVVQYIDTTTDSVKTVIHNFSDNKYKPDTISKAPNYMNKTQLSIIVQNRWKSGLGKYTESY